MEAIEILLLALAVLVPCLFFAARSKYPHVPGPGLRQYLPGGEMFAMLADNRKMCGTLVAMQKKYGHVYQVWIGPMHTIVTAVPADVAQVHSATESFDRPLAMNSMFDVVIPGSLFTMSKQVHIAARRHLRDSFNFTFLKEFHSHMIHATDELCQSLTQAAQDPATDSFVNISKLLSVTTFRVITNAAFGIDLTLEERLKFAESTNQLIEEMLLDIVGYPLRHVLTPFGARKRLFSSKKKVRDFSSQILQRRLNESTQENESRPKDMLDAILTLKDHDLTALTSQTVLFAIAGSHTTNEVLAWAIYEITCNPNVATEIHKELKIALGDKPLEHEDVETLSYLKCVWQETLRLHPPGGFVMRVASKDLHLVGSKLKVTKGTNVLSLVQGAHTISSVWSHPEKFMPERWAAGMQEGEKAPPGAFIPFSAGRKGCAGRFLADYEAILILARLYRQFDFTLACAPTEIVGCSGWLQSARSCKDGSDFGFGVPVHVHQRS